VVMAGTMIKLAASIPVIAPLERCIEQHPSRVPPILNPRQQETVSSPRSADNTAFEAVVNRGQLLVTTRQTYLTPTLKT
jgi:hypothetical protein